MYYLMVMKFICHTLKIISLNIFISSAAATGTNFRLKKLCVNVENVRVADITKFTPSSSRNREKVEIFNLRLKL